MADNLAKFVSNQDPYRKNTIKDTENYFDYLINPISNKKPINYANFYKYTHLFFPWSMLGLVALTSPFVNYS